ncbi:MAG: serine hydrolase [Planctomycetota bacterium]
MKTITISLPVALACLVLLAQQSERDGAATPQWVTPAVRAPRVEYRTFDSASAKTKVSYHIYTPEIYDAEKERRFPVLYWLHGSGPGTAGVPWLAAHFDAAIKAGKIPPMLVVFPNGLATGMWCDSKDGRVPVETMVIKELLPHVDAGYRTIAKREGRIIEGFSVGGYGAARLGFKHHDLFATVSILSGGPLQREFTVAPRVRSRGGELRLPVAFGGDHDYFKAQSPWVLAEQNAAPLSARSRIRLIIGDRDEMLVIVREFDAHLTRLGIPHTFTVLPGIGHNPKAVLDALGESNWEFYRAAFGSKPQGASLADSKTAMKTAAPDAANMEAAQRYSEAAGGQAMVVMCDGKVVFERYGNDGGADRLQMLASGSKSFVGVAAVAAVEDGILRLDDAACEALTEWKDDPKKSRITYRQLLTLTSGLTPGEQGAAVTAPAWKEIVNKPMSGEPGGQFEYGAYHLNAFAAAMEQRLGGETFEAYLKRRILDPLEIKVEWRFRCRDGHPQVGGGAFMTARDWAVFGEFMRLGGQWSGKQVIRKELLAECLHGTKQNPAYGLTWWLREEVPDAIIRQVPILQRDMGDIVKSDWLPEDLFMAAGAGKQRLYVIPSLKMVIIRQGELRASRSFSDAEFLDRLLRAKQEEKE